VKGKITLFCAFLIASEAFCQVSLLPDFLQTSSNFTSEEAAPGKVCQRSAFSKIRFSKNPATVPEKV
jgi:hypothetical protein